MAFRAFIASAGIAALATGCYVETAEDRAPTPGGKSEPTRDAGDVGTCRYALGKGCFDGHVVAKQEFFVDGKQFFNADDLATRFHELVEVNAEGKALTAGQDFQLALTTPVDNNSFVSGFEYDLVGETTRGGKMKTDGGFSLNDLPEGVYQLRVQRAVKFDVTRDETLPAEPVARDGQPAPEPRKVSVVKSYCATLYADTSVEVRKGKRTAENFGDFKLHVTDNECAAGGNRTSLTLKP